MAPPNTPARVIASGDLAITFAPRERGPARLLAQPEVHFLDGSLAGLCLRGFSVWSGGSEPHLTFPRSASGYHFLTRSRLVAPSTSHEAERRVREFILKALRRA
jgi:hypothetical protein